MAFYIAYADANGNRIVSSEYLLPISPTNCDYPKEALAVLHETSDGQVIKQQPNKDNRRRAWIWVGYRDDVVIWPAIWERLEGLLSRTLVEAGAPTPYAYVKDTVSNEMRIRDSVFGIASGGTSTTLTSVQSWTTNAYIDYRIHLLDGTGAGQSRTVVSNTATSVTVDEDWLITPDATTKFEIYKLKPEWVRVRVLDVSRTLREGGGQVTYPESKFVFVIDDPAYNDFK